MLPTTPYRRRGASGFRSQCLVLAKDARFRLRQCPVMPRRAVDHLRREHGGARTKKIRKPYNTRDSLVVPYQSTDRAQRCLTSQFGWDAVLSPWYDRMTSSLPPGNTLLRKLEITKKKKNHEPFVFLNFLFGCCESVGATPAAPGGTARPGPR